ncbi:MAG: KH domain-containing protein, partial [Bacillota bacterium]
GKLIGKSGRTAKAIRTLVRACSARHGKRATVEIV